VDSTVLIAGFFVFLIAIGVMYRVGYRRIQREEAFVSNAMYQISQIHNAKFLGRIAYHGGFPQIPRPTQLFLGMADDGLVLYDGQNPPEQAFCRDWLEVDQFSVMQKAEGAYKSIALLGPLVPFFYKDKTRHFITIHYSDVDRDENYIVLEAADKATQGELYGEITGAPHWKKNVQALSSNTAFSSLENSTSQFARA